MARSAKININLHVGQQLRACRVGLGLSQEAVGKAIGMASQQVQKYEKGINSMNTKRIYEFALFLKVPVAYFFEGLPNAAGGLSISRVRRASSGGAAIASDRESLEILKSFKEIRDYAVRKRLADLLRSLSLKEI
jgi:transcriptional regulator with XRE-family HTH domain